MSFKTELLLSLIFGSIDITYGTPVINYPELAILGVGKITKKPVVENSQIVIADSCFLFP
ncbi:2-oxo acid dehydrogenase subunit E2 [Areca yellow leaf disease phytoplasma]|uniref:2-oxo acid dehydrogenase subunit E2 n=1 Tax=Areca yellow leaf disease phytoplasma TaxID=927614 RepID=UPI0035B527BE